MSDERPRALDTAISFVILVAVSVQTYMVLNESTNGALEMELRQWWRYKGRPIMQRCSEWFTSAEITERMVNEEIVPFLEREAQ